MGDGRSMDSINFEPDEFVNNIKQWFGEDECVKMLDGQPNGVTIDVAYYPQINEFRGQKKLQVKLESYRKS